MKDLISLKEAAETLDVTTYTIRNWIRNGILKYADNNERFLIRSSFNNIIDRLKKISDDEKDIKHYEEQIKYKKERLESVYSSLEKEYSFISSSKSIICDLFSKAYEVLYRGSITSERDKKITMSYLKGMRFYEISDMYDISPERVRQIIYRQMATLSRSDKYSSLLKENRLLKKQIDAMSIKINMISKYKGDDNEKEFNIEEFKKNEKMYILSENLFNLDLSARTINVLRGTDLKTIYDLVRLNRLDLLKYRNFGKKSLIELEDMLSDRGLRFGMKDKDITEFLNEDK